MGPYRSPWTSSSGRVARYAVVFGNDFLVCFPRRQDVHVSVSTLIAGMPITRSVLIIAFIVLVLMCPRRACHLDDSPFAVI